MCVITNAIAADPNSPYPTDKLSFSSSLIDCPETCKVIHRNALLKYESEESVSVESLESYEDSRNRRAIVSDETITLQDMGAVTLLTSKMSSLHTCAEVSSADDQKAEHRAVHTLIGKPR